VDAIIFDFDGTIIETEGPDCQTWQEIFAAHGCELPLTTWVGYIGTAAGTFDPYRLLTELSGRSIDRPAIQGVRRQRFRELVAAQPLRPGVMALIEAAAQQGVPLAIASSSTQDWVEWNLDQRDLRRYFQVVYTVNDVSRGKPDPELYLKAVAALGVAAASTVALEDSVNGLLAAKAAGLRCVVAPNVLTQGMAFAEADLVVESLAEVDLARLRGLVIGG
jgi:HAD superfamily hydrolase (TIGR01509 family)